jgi:hypothetical protein
MEDKEHSSSLHLKMEAIETGYTPPTIPIILSRFNKKKCNEKN